MPQKTELELLENKLCRVMAHTSTEYHVLEPGDRILVAVSGGKDSYGMLWLLDRMRRRLPFSIDIKACHIHLGQPDFNSSVLSTWLADSGMPFEIVSENIFAPIQASRDKGESGCTICARLRRGLLYTTAKRLGFNKVALGHHRKDTLATFMLNLCFNGKLQAMPPKYTTNDGALEVIRPIIETRERDLARLAVLRGFPLVPCGGCGCALEYERASMSALLDELEDRYPDVKSVMLGALKNVRPTHLFDPTVIRAPKE